MLNKLLKYDLKYMLKNMCVFYILSIFFAITTRIFFSLEQTTIIKILGQISVGCMFSMLVSTLINAMMRSWVRFRDSIYKDEGYLTNTLPVTKNQLFDSKFLQTLIFFVIGFIVILVSLFVAYYTPDRWLLLTTKIDKLTTGLNTNIVLILCGIIVLLFLEFFCVILCGFLGIIMGYKRNSSKLGASVLFGFVAYIIEQSIVLASIGVLAVFNKDVMELFKSNVVLEPGLFKFLIMYAIIVYTILGVIICVISKRRFNKGIDLE